MFAIAGAAGCTSVLGDFSVGQGVGTGDASTGSDGSFPDGTSSTSDAAPPSDSGSSTGSSSTDARADQGMPQADATPDVALTTPAMLSISPTTYAFATSAVGAAGPTQTFAVTNGGGTASVALTTGLTFGVGTGPTEFAITADACQGIPLMAGGSCLVTVKFDPATFGSKSASLVVDGGLQATMTGIGEDSLTLTVTKTGGGGGTVTDASGQINCGPTCSARFERTTTDPLVTLSATPDSASSFNGWTGGGCSGTGPCVVTLSTAATAVTATFAPHWTAIGTSTAIGAYVPQMTAALGTFLYFASTTQFESFGTSSGAFSALPAIPAFSYEGPMVAGSSALYYLYDNGLSQFSGSWTTLISNSSTPGSGLGAMGTTAYAFGASPPYAGAWVDVVGTWSASVANMPLALSDACTGADPTAGKFYVFGGNTPPNPNTYAYTVSTNSWAQVAGNGPLTCQRMATTTWNGNLVYADSQGVHELGLSTLAWGTTLPLPSPTPYTPVALSTGAVLYLLGYDGASTDTVYEWTP